MANSLLDLQEMKPTPRNQLLGLLADALTAGRNFADRAKVPAAVPVLGGQGLGSLLLGKAPEELTEISYGNMPLRINPLAGRTASFVFEIKPGRKEQLADLVMAAQAVPGGNRAALAALGAVDTGANKAAIVWHGSPHKFDRFDASKIGTGEGAQAYGHGLYLAESPDVAKIYKDTLAYKAFDLKPEAEARGLALSAGARGEFIRQAQANVDPAVAARRLQNANISARGLPQDKLAELFAAYQKDGGGQLYKVDLPDNMIARMLDWDKPLSQQSEGVRAALQAADRRAKDSLYGSGGEYYRALMSRHAQNMPLHMSVDAAENMAQAPASQQLRALGIPGIRYLDGGSRNISQQVQTAMDGLEYWKKVGDPSKIAQAERVLANAQKMNGFGTSNFVVFPGEEQYLRILERNGGLLSP